MNKIPDGWSLKMALLVLRKGLEGIDEAPSNVDKAALSLVTGFGKRLVNGNHQVFLHLIRAHFHCCNLGFAEGTRGMSWSSKQHEEKCMHYGGCHDAYAQHGPTRET